MNNFDVFKGFSLLSFLYAAIILQTAMATLV